VADSETERNDVSDSASNQVTEFVFPMREKTNWQKAGPKQQAKSPEVSNSHGLRNVGQLQHAHFNIQFAPCGGSLFGWTTKFEQQRTTRPRFARAIGKLGKASHFLQQL
jgi:hypothetical protein